MKNDITIAGGSLRIYTAGVLRFDMRLDVICRTAKRIKATLQILARKSWWVPSMAEQIYRMAVRYVHNH